MKSIRITCVRHGETTHNLKHIIQGWIGSNLTELGHKQAHDFAKQYNKTPEAIFYSDLSRAKQTVEPLLNKFPDIPSFADWRLRERSFGTIEGRMSADIDWEALSQTPPDESWSGIEPRNHVGERVKSFMRDLELLGISHALVITHGGILNQIKRTLDPNHTKAHHANLESCEFEYSFDNPLLRPGKIPKWSIHDKT